MRIRSIFFVLVCLVLAAETTLHAEPAYIRTVHTPTLPIELDEKALRLHYGTMQDFESGVYQVYFSFAVGKVTTNDGKKVFKHRHGFKRELSVISIKEIAKLRRALTKAQFVAKEWADGQPLGDEVEFQRVIVPLGENLNLRLSRASDEPTAFFLFTGHPELGTVSILGDASNFLVIGNIEEYLHLTTEITERIDATIRHLRSAYPTVDKAWNWDDLLKQSSVP